MKITFIHHSCFCVETESCSMIFDYWKRELPEFDKSKPLYVFSSHAHGDHYNPQVLKLREKYPFVKFILSDDISAGTADDIVYVEANKIYHIDQLLITTYFSTDEGVAFRVETDGKCLIHFGDLNWWHWEGEIEKFNREQEKYFKREVGQMKDKPVDAAFGPALDKRLEPNHWWGMHYFLENVDVKHVFPMHFFEEYSICQETVTMKDFQPYQGKIHIINGPMEVFEI